MMPTVGGVSSDLLRGVRRPPTELVQLHRMVGFDGYSAQKVGKADAEFRYRAIRFATNATIETWATSIYALKGTVVTIVDEFGATLTNMLIMDITPLQRRAAATPAAPTQLRGELEITGVQVL